MWHLHCQSFPLVVEFRWGVLSWSVVARASMLEEGWAPRLYSKAALPEPAW